MVKKFDEKLLVYLLNKIASTNQYDVKKTLQNIHQALSNGYTLNSEQSQFLSMSLIGCIEFNNKNSDIIRWCLNIITLIPKNNSRIQHDQILKIIKPYESNNDVIISGISTLSTFKQLSYKDIQKQLNVENTQLINIASLLANKNQFDINNLPIINPEKDNPYLLKAFLILLPKICNNSRILNVLLGNKTIENTLLSLTQNDESSVRQYAFCSLSETTQNITANFTPNLISSITDDNTLEWAVKYCAKLAYSQPEFRDIISEFANSDIVNIRYGLSSGLINVIYPSLENLIIKWFIEENNIEIKINLIRHMTNFSYNMTYQNFILEILQENTYSKIIEIYSQGTPVWQIIQKNKEENFNMSFKLQNSGSINISGNNNIVGNNNNIINNNIDSILNDLTKIQDDQLSTIIEQINMYKNKQINSSSLKNFLSMTNIKNIISSVNGVEDIISKLYQLLPPM